MEIISFIPGNIVSPNPITIPTYVPDIDAVVLAEIERVPIALAAHPAADIRAGLVDHAAATVRDALVNHAAADIRDALANHSAAQMQAALANHTQAQIVDAIANHAVHAHGLRVQAGAAVQAFGASGAGVADLRSASGQTIPGGVVATGIQDYATPAHAGGANPVVHAGAANVGHGAGVAAVAHGLGGAAMVHGAGANVTHTAANPVVTVATVTKSTVRRITLNVDTLLGDILTLYYLAVGERVAVS